MPVARRCGPLAAVLLPLALAGCSGTRLGDALSRSFSGAPAAPAGSSAVAGARSGVSGSMSTGPGGSATPSSGVSPGRTTADGTSPAITPGKTSDEGKTPPEGKGRSMAATTVPPASGTARPTPLPVAGRPAPYRVTILLPQADASAPAEVVTQALRAAGVPFEVETIERIGAGSAAPAGAAATAAPAPTVRPAPAPR